jgi:hypothetical protein
LIWSALAIEFSVFRCSKSVPKLKGQILEFRVDDSNEDNLKDFLEKIFIGPPKEIYELLGMYGYFLENTLLGRKAIIIKD